nr:MAG TPA: hypothetical protein [Caudoviricetes sp.]
MRILEDLYIMVKYILIHLLLLQKIYSTNTPI